MRNDDPVREFLRLAAGAAVGLLVVTLAFAAANQAPSATMTSPANGSLFTAPASIPLAATASDADGTIQRVEFYSGKALIGTAPTAPYAFQWNNVPGGTYSVTAKAIDNGGKAGTSPAIQVRVATLTTTITAPAEGAVLPIGSVLVSGAFTGPSATTTVMVTAGGGHTSLANISGNSFSTVASLAPGANSIEVQVARRDGTSEVAVRNVTAVDPPVVAITKPSFFGPYTVPAQVTLEADAASAQGTIARVEFLDNGVSVGNATSAPFSVSRDLTTAGNHTILARAFDSFGFQAQSRPIVLVAQSQPPVVAITAPTNGDSFRAGGSVSFAATASDADGTVTRVDYLANGSVVGGASAPPYAFTWNDVPANSYRLTARATDNSGTFGTSAPVDISVTPNSPPTVSLTSPSSGATYTSPATIAFAANAADSDGTVTRVEFLANNVVVGQDTSAPYEFSWTNVVAGSYSLRARAFDDGNASFTSAAVLVTVSDPPPNQLPSVTLTSPTNGATFTAPVDITISANASDPDGSIAKVEFLDNATLLATLTSAPYTFNWRNVMPGGRTVSAVATDNQGATRQASAAITVNGTAATVTAPQDGATFTAPASYNVDATVMTSTGNITRIEIYDGTTMIAFADTNLPATTVSYPYASVPAGSHVHTVKAFHTSGPPVTSQAVTVTVLQGPEVTLTAPTSSRFYMAPAVVNFSATTAHFANPIASIEYLANGAVVASSSAAPFSASWSNVPAGSYAIEARATDTLGIPGLSAQVPIVVAAEPSVVVDPGIDGTTVAADRIMVTGTVQTLPNSSIKVNGASGDIDPAGRFVVNGVALAPGGNTLTVQVSTIDGQTAQQVINVTREGDSPFVLHVSPTGTMAPARIRFFLENRAGIAIKKLELDTTGSGALQDVTAFGTTLVLQYNGAGTYFPRFVVTDFSDLTYSVRAGLVILSAPYMNALLRGALDEMLGKLAAGQTSLALNHVTTGATPDYSEVFDAIVAGGNAPQVVAQFGVVTEGTFSNVMAELLLVRDQATGPASAFRIYFIKSDDGIWRVDAM